MNVNTYDIGDAPLITAEFRITDTDTATDPASVSFLWRTPDGTETAYQWGMSPEVTRDGTGLYRFLPPAITEHGQHAARVKSTGIPAAAELVIEARRSAFDVP